MTIELWNTFATFGTFLVIAATAIAALVQLRHARGGNQIAVLKDLNDEAATPQFAAAEQLVISGLAAKLNDAEFRYYLNTRCATTGENMAMRTAARDMGNYYENMGLLVRTGLIDCELACNLWSRTATVAWGLLTPYTAIARQVAGDALWENFEYFVVLCQDWIAAHPKGDYPTGLRRLPIKNEWLEADRQYATSRASS